MALRNPFATPEPKRCGTHDDDNSDCPRTRLVSQDQCLSPLPPKILHVVKEDENKRATTGNVNEGKSVTFLLQGNMENRWLQFLWEVQSAFLWEYGEGPSRDVLEVKDALANRLWLTILTLGVQFSLAFDMQRSTDMIGFLYDQERVVRQNRNKVKVFLTPCMVTARLVPVGARLDDQRGLTVNISMMLGVIETKFTSLVLPLLAQNGIFHIDYY